VILYELLAGSRPYRIKAGAALGIVEQTLAEARIQMPSTRIESAAARARATTVGLLSRRLRGDLDAIVMKALERDPLRRYRDAGLFADDLRRFLRAEPVLAKPQTAGYRLGKLLLRHRALSAAMLIAGLSVLALSWVLIQQSEVPLSPLAGSAEPLALAAKSIAVLPFADVSEHKDQEYFSDGLTDELIDHLSRRSDLRVISRTSSFRFKGEKKDIRAIATQLTVGHLLLGSVRKAGNSLHVSMELVRASDGARVWSQVYDRSFADIFTVRAEIANTVATALHTTLTGGVQLREEVGSTEAYNLVLRGRYFLRRGTKEDSAKAIATFRQALALAPESAFLWIELAQAYNRVGLFGWMAPNSAYLEARRATDQALGLKPDSAAAHQVLASIEWNFRFDFAKSAAEAKRARDLDPMDAMVTARDVSEASAFGRTADAVLLARQFAEADPLDLFKQLYLASTLFDDGRLDEAEKVTRGAIDLDPRTSGANNLLAQILVARNQPLQALDVAAKEADEGNRLQSFADAYWALGRVADSDAALSQLRSRYGAELAYEIAASYALRGDRDSAFVWLNRALENHEAQVSFIRSDRQLRALRQDPRFDELLVKLRLDERSLARRTTTA